MLLSFDQCLNKRATPLKSLFRVLGKRAGDNWLIAFGKRGQRWGLVQVLGRQASGRSPIERRFAGQHLLIHDGQTVLVAVAVGLALE